MASSNPVTKFDAHPAEKRTFARQDELPKLPIPPLEETCRRYLAALEGLQDPAEHEVTKRAVEDFLQNDGPRVQERLIEYAKDKARCARYLVSRIVVIDAYVCAYTQLYRRVLVWHLW